MGELEFCRVRGGRDRDRRAADELDKVPILFSFSMIATRGWSSRDAPIHVSHVNSYESHARLPPADGGLGAAGRV